MFPWYETRCERHSACLNRELPCAPRRRRGAPREWTLTGSRRLDRLRPFDIPLSSASRSDLPPRSTDWTDRARNVPVGHASNSQTCANCQWSADRSIIQSLFSFFFFPHPQSPVPKEGPVGHYRAISSEIPVWTSGGKLMCYCDERFLSQRVRVASKSPKWRDKISW